MSDTTKLHATHRCRCALVDIRQSTAHQVERTRESTDRQDQLVERAIARGWRRAPVSVVDEDLGVSADGSAVRAGVAPMASEIALGRVGIVLGIEVARWARNNADWYRWLDLCGVTDTLIADADGIYHPGLCNDRLLLGLNGTMSEAELHVWRARLNGGIRNKAARGELRRGLPVGLIWGEPDGAVRFHPDDAVTGAIRTVFERFAEMGSARQVWLWWRSQQLQFPLQTTTRPAMRWVTATYTAIHQVLTSPVSAGAYGYGQTRQERDVDEPGHLRKRLRRLPRAEWAVRRRDHHTGCIDWETYEANQRRLASTTRPRPHDPGGAVREGAAVLQGLASCGQCGRRLSVFYRGRHSSPGYQGPGDTIANGRGQYCLRIGGRHVAHAVAATVLAARAPAGVEASLHAAEQIEATHEVSLAQWRRQGERAAYEAPRAERRYRAVDAENRLVARGLAAAWEKRLHELQAAPAELVPREQQRRRSLSVEEHPAVLALGNDLEWVWSAATTADRDRQELLHTLLEEVIITVDAAKSSAQLTVRWRGGLISQIDVLRSPTRTLPPMRTAEDTIELVRRLAGHYPDTVIAGILNRQARRTATGRRFNTNAVGNLRRHWSIPRFTPPADPPSGALVTVAEAATRLGIAASTVHRWLNDGCIAGEQLTPGAPWCIRLTDERRSRFVEDTPTGYVPMIDATRLCGVTRQTVLPRVKRGELDAVHVCRGRRKGLRIKLPEVLPDLFHPTPSARG